MFYSPDEEGNEQAVESLVEPWDLDGEDEAYSVEPPEFGPDGFAGCEGPGPEAGEDADAEEAVGDLVGAGECLGCAAADA